MAHAVYELIDAQDRLQDAVAEFAREPILALDLECDNNLHHYGSRVCLFQVAGASRVAVIDALAGLDLQPLLELFADPGIEKVMHDTDFDVRCLRGEYGIRPRNLFDTLIAARLAGHKRFGVAALLEHYFGLVHSKKLQRADWSRRPLTREMLDYAAGDVTHLIELRHLLAAELAAAERFDWAREQFAECEERPMRVADEPLFMRVKGAGRLRGRTLAILAALAEEREAIARKLDLPPFKVISSEGLIAIAEHPPRDAAELAARRGMHPYLRREGAARFIAAISRGRAAPIPVWPRKRASGNRPQEDKELLAYLKEWRTAAAEERGLDADLILPQRVLKRIAAGEGVDEALADDEVWSWQRHAVGDELRQALSRRAGKRGGDSG